MNKQLRKIPTSEVKALRESLNISIDKMATEIDCFPDFLEEVENGYANIWEGCRIGDNFMRLKNETTTDTPVQRN